MFTFKGELIKAFPAKEGIGKNQDAAVRDFIVKETKTNAEYPQTAKFSLYKSGEYAKYVTEKFPSEGSIVEVTFSLSLREYKKGDKTFNIQDLRAFKLMVLQQANMDNVDMGEDFDDGNPF